MTTTGWRLSNDDGDSNDNGKKNPTTKQQLCKCITLFLVVFLISRRCTTDKWNIQFSRPHYGVGENNTKRNLENFANNQRQIKWNWIRSIKFQTARIYFWNEFSVCCYRKILLPWQRDVTTSPLYSKFVGIKWWRGFSHDVTAAILVFQNNETAAISVPRQSCGSWIFFLRKHFLLLLTNKFAEMLATWVKTLYCV